MPTLTHRKASETGYRVSADGVEIGSISLQEKHTLQNRDVWAWGIDIMPLMDHGGRPPGGECESFEEARDAFKREFIRWHAQIDPELWRENMDYKHAAATRHLKR